MTNPSLVASIKEVETHIKLTNKTDDMQEENVWKGETLRDMRKDKERRNPEELK